MKNKYAFISKVISLSSQKAYFVKKLNILNNGLYEIMNFYFILIIKLTRCGKREANLDIYYYIFRI